MGIPDNCRRPVNFPNISTKFHGGCAAQARMVRQVHILLYFYVQFSASAFLPTNLGLLERIPFNGCARKRKKNKKRLINNLIHLANSRSDKLSRYFLPKDGNLGALKSAVWHVYVRECVGVGACPAVGGRKPGRFRRRPARGF